MKCRLTHATIATLAVVSALALSGQPASAAATSTAVSAGTQAELSLTPVECTNIRQEIWMLQSFRAQAQEELQHATPSQKGDLVREILGLTAEIQALSRQLVGCPA
jgi:hypothetical protein